MSRVVRALALCVLALALSAGGVAAAVESRPVAGQGRTTIVVEPAVYADLVQAGVEITAIGRATVRPYEDTVAVSLPVTETTGSAVKHGGGFRLASDDAVLTVRRVTIPRSGFVSGTVSGSEVGEVGRVPLFFQAPSGSPLGDTSLRFTFTFASYLNASFGTGFRELGYFGYATTHTP